MSDRCYTNNIHKKRELTAIEEFFYYNKKTNIVDEKIIRILIQPLIDNQTEKVFWTDDFLHRNDIGFMFQKKNEDILVSQISLNNIKKISVEDFCKTKELANNNLFFLFNLTEDQYHFIDTGIKNEFIDYNNANHTTLIFHDWNEFVEAFITFPSLQFIRVTEFNRFITDINRLFGKIILDEPKIEIVSRHYATKDVFIVLHVIEKRLQNKNFRIVLLYHSTDQKYCLKIITDEDPTYVYYDKDRVFFNMDNKNIFFDLAVNEYEDGYLIINQELIRDIAINIPRLLSINEYIITPSMYRFYKERIFSASYDKKSPLTIQQQKIVSQYINLLQHGSAIKFNDVTITSTSIDMDGLSLKFENDFLEITDDYIFNKIREIINNDTKYNLNLFFEKILGLSIIKKLETQNNFISTHFTVNNMQISIIKEKTRLKINGIFCRILDTKYILSRAICYTDVKEYQKYIKDVSFIGVDWTKMISHGVLIRLRNPLQKIFLLKDNNLPTESLMRFSLLWDTTHRQKVYLTLNSNNYEIQYKGKFKQYFNSPELITTIEKLKVMLKESVLDFREEMLYSIVDNAIEEAKIIKERGQELVQNVITDINAIEERVMIHNHPKDGYTFFGKKTNTKFFIDKHTLEVFKLDNGNWNRRCILDSASKNRIFEDKLANRLANIYNEPNYLANFLKT